MKNKYLRLFVAQTKLMTAEKMKLDRFCQHGEYFSYNIALPANPEFDLKSSDDLKFIFAVELCNDQYYFTHETTKDKEFTLFEQQLSDYLNVLFKRKQEFDGRNKMFKNVMNKLITSLNIDEQRCLATNIDANTTNVLRALGVDTEDQLI